DLRTASALQLIPTSALRNFATGKRYVWKKRVTVGRTPSVTPPDSFVVECFNPSEQTINLSLTMRSSCGTQTIPFQKLVPVAPGFHREEIPTSEISRTFDLQSPFSLELIPNDIPDGTTLYFGLMDFVQCKPQVAAVAKNGKSKVKCIVWDLDNT